MIRELGALVLVDSMTNIGIRALDSDLPSFGFQSRGCLSSHLDVQLVQGWRLRKWPVTSYEGKTYLDPIFELNFTAGIDADMFQDLSSLIIRLSARLKCMKNGRFVDSSWRIGADRTAGGI